MPWAFPYLATKVCNILAPFAMEFVGTFFLVAAVGFNSVGAHPLAPLGIGLTLVVCIFAGGHISGSALPPLTPPVPSHFAHTSSFAGENRSALQPWYYFL